MIVHNKPLGRIDFLDATKALGMILVFCGHYLEKLYYDQENDAAFLLMKLIYAFHMPLFFFLAGMFWKPQKIAMLPFLANKIQTRIFPIIFFATITIPFWLEKGMPLISIGQRGLFYLFGLNLLNAMTWFLFCLFSAEIIVALFTRFFTISSTKQGFFCAVMFSILGWLVTTYGFTIASHTGIIMNLWFINEAFVAVAFYFLGFSMKDIIISDRRLSVDIAVTSFFGLLLLTTFNLNEGPFFPDKDMVTMASSNHGNPLLFYGTATAGILFVITLMKLINPKIIALKFVGTKTVIYLGLSGIAFHFIDNRIMNYIDYHPNSIFMALLYALSYSLIVMLIFSPAVFLLARYLPAIVGLKSHSRFTKFRN